MSIMYVAMATVVPLDYQLPLKQGTSFPMLFFEYGMFVLGLFVQSVPFHIDQIYKNMEWFLQYCALRLMKTEG